MKLNMISMIVLAAALTACGGGDGDSESGSGSGTTTTPDPTASEVCHDAVQGKIAWNYTGSKSWNETNVTNLCKGAEDSTEPATCFQRVMHSGVNWGSGIIWKWQNALELCAGTRNSNATVSCFEQEISIGKTWSPAIDSCKA